MAEFPPGGEGVEPGASRRNVFANVRKQGAEYYAAPAVAARLASLTGSLETLDLTHDDHTQRTAQSHKKDTAGKDEVLVGAAHADHTITHALRRAKTSLSLSICGLSLGSLPSQVTSAVFLTELDVSSNGLRALDPALKALTHLAILNIEDNLLTSLPPWMGVFARLTSLMASNNKLASVGAVVACRELQDLFLSGNMLEELPLDIGKLVLLRQLVVDGQASPLNHLAGLNLGSDGALRGNDAVSVADLASTASTPRLAPTRNLSMLLRTIDEEEHASETQGHRRIGATLRDVTQAAKTQAQFLEESEFERMTWVPTLTSVPRSVLALKNLEILLLHNNGLITLPEGIALLPRLCTLRVDGNPLGAVPSALLHPRASAPLADAAILYMSRMGLSRLPDVFGNLASLTHIYLNDNYLAALPDSLGSLPCLTVLDVAHNALTAFPEQLLPLAPTLTHLDLSANALSGDPEAIAAHDLAGPGSFDDPGAANYSGDDEHDIPDEVFESSDESDGASYCPSSSSSSSSLALLRASTPSIDGNVPIAASTVSIVARPKRTGAVTVRTSQFTPQARLLAKARRLRTQSVLRRAQPTKSFSLKIGDLFSLHTLSLARCSLDAVPHGIFRLGSLTSLDLSHNNFVSIPPMISCLTNLRSLAIAYCRRLRSLPHQLATLTSLRFLDIEGADAVTDPPQATVIQGGKAVLTHIRAHHLHPSP